MIGSKEFVNAAFSSASERFGPKRCDGARSMRGSGSGAKGMPWTARDLRVEVWTNERRQRSEAGEEMTNGESRMSGIKRGCREAARAATLAG